MEQGGNLGGGSLVSRAHSVRLFAASGCSLCPSCSWPVRRVLAAKTNAARRQLCPAAHCVRLCPASRW
eukprot:4206322-Alexandrium_andersonii.AAC.1